MGEKREREKKSYLLSPNPLPFSIPPNLLPLPLSTPRFFPDYFWTCGNDVTNSIKSINSCISIISLCQSARRPFPKFTAFKCALILRLPRFSNKQLARRLYQPFLLRSINISNTERRQFQFQFNSTFNETTR